MSSPNFRFHTLRELLKRLDDPHLAFPVVHVAGTKGKGSVCHFLNSIATASGLRTGLYSSPHLISVEERFRINGDPVESKVMNDLLKRIRPIVDDLDELAEHNEQFHRPTFFEITTALAFLHFAISHVDLGIIEVGLGGRLDSTNVCQSQLCVITNISLDHMAQLGNSLTSIAKEKAGIIKPATPVICGAQQVDARNAIHGIARERSAPISQLGEDFRATELTNPDDDLNPEFGVRGQVFSDPFELDKLKCGLAGKHQVENAALAVASIIALKRIGIVIDHNTIQMGLANTKVPGRYQRHKPQGLPTLRLDIAHNEASMEALATTLQSDPEFQSAKKRVLIYSVCRGKQNDKMLQRILPHFDEIVFTKFNSNPRALAVDKLVQAGHEIDCDAKIYAIADVNQVLPWLREHCESDDFICITGSNFLVADLTPMLVD